MFDAPKIFSNIPDIAQIYEINDKQSDGLDEAINQLNDDIFLDTMSESKTERWEKMLSITHQDNDTISDRRFRIKAKVLEKLPYSYRVIINKLNTLCPNGYTFELSEDRIKVSVKLVLDSKKMINDVKDMLERMLPLNMLYSVEILYNTYAVLSGKTYDYLSSYTYQNLRDEIIE